MSATLEKYYSNEARLYSDPMTGPGTQDFYEDPLSDTPGLDADYDIETGEDLSDDGIGNLLDEGTYADEDLGDYGDDWFSGQDEYGAEDVGLSELNELYENVDRSGTPDEPELLATLEEAMRAEEAGDDDLSAEKYNEVYQSLESHLESEAGSENETDWDEYSEDPASMNPTPSRIENGVRYYQGGPGENSVSLFGSGEEKEYVIEFENGEVTIQPQSPEAEVEIKERGQYLEVVIEQDGTREVFKVHKSNRLHVASDHVVGDVDMEETQITMGLNSYQTLISEDFLKDLERDVGRALNKLGHVVYTDPEAESEGIPLFGPSSDPFGGMLKVPDVEFTGEYALGYQDPDKLMNADWEELMSKSQEGEEQVARVLAGIKDIFDEEDPQQRQIMWSNVVNDLQRINAEAPEAGNVNNRGQLLFNALYGELGEENFQKAIELGIIPQDFVVGLINTLNVVPEEDYDTHDEVRYQQGGEGWSHGATVQWLKNSIDDSGILPEE